MSHNLHLLSSQNSVFQKVDAIWTTIRIAPAELPQGEFFLIPGSVYTRLRHQPLKPVSASGKLQVDGNKSLEGNSMVRYEVHFPDENRVFKIYFERDFPYRIQGWEDTYRGLIGMGAKILTTSATRTHTIMTDYWNHNRNKDRRLLKESCLHR